MTSIFLILTFISSFATMCYAMITASIISDFTGEEIFSQCLTMGPYLLGLGLGSLIGDKVPREKSLGTFWKFEWMSVVLLPLIPVFHIVFIFLFINFSPLNTSLDSKMALKIILSMAAVISFGAGILGGAQLPLIIHEVSEKIKAEIVLAVNYMGPLFAGPFIVYCNSQSLPASVQTGIVALLQITGLLILIFLSHSRVKKMIVLSIPLLLVVFIARVYPEWEYLTHKASYIGTKMKFADLFRLKQYSSNLKKYGEFERVRTPYQVIDFFVAPGLPEVASPGNFTLYLNRKTQFDSFQLDIYHQSMVYGGLNLLGKTPDNVLVLGAGDGLLLKELKAYKDIKTITMVELDPGIINWASNNPIMSELNDFSLTEKDPRFDIVLTDAVSFLRTHPTNKKYDFILVDFPFPNGHELSKLYSIEFYELLKKVTSPETILVIDMPIVYLETGEIEPETEVILKTLKTAGFKERLAFGPHASFLATTLQNRSLKFDFTKFPEHMALSARVNLVEIMDEEEIQKNEKNVPINSMFWPRGL